MTIELNVGDLILYKDITNQELGMVTKIHQGLCFISWCGKNRNSGVFGYTEDFTKKWRYVFLKEEKKMMRKKT